MRQRIEQEPQEPVGIVIVGGWPREVTPRFAAFEWGPAPEDDTRRDLVTEAKAA